MICTSLLVNVAPAVDPECKSHWAWTNEPASTKDSSHHWSIWCLGRLCLSVECGPWWSVTINHLEKNPGICEKQIPFSVTLPLLEASVEDHLPGRDCAHWRSPLQDHRSFHGHRHGGSDPWRSEMSGSRPSAIWPRPRWAKFQWENGEEKPREPASKQHAACN